MKKTFFTALLFFSVFLFSEEANSATETESVDTKVSEGAVLPLAREGKESVIPVSPTTLPVAQGDLQFDEKRDPEADDMEALRRWIRDKRFVTLKELGGDLSISGEARTEFQDSSEIKNGIRQVGEGSSTNKAQYAWDSEVNIMIDYRTDRAWAAIKVEFDNDMGVRSGTVSRLRLEKGYFGGRLVPGDTFTFDIEIGRRYLFNVFDSQIEFSALYDGVLFRLNKAWPSIGNFYCNIGGLLVNDRKNHYAYVSEIGGLRIANIGLNIKYSIINWYKPSANLLNDLRFKFLNSQLQISYQYYPKWIGKRLLKFYAAGLTNHLAGGVPQTHNKRQNWAWYAGLSIGVVKKQYDFAINANYQWVQAQALSDFDGNGIGRGNAEKVGLYTNNINGNPNSGETTAETTVGNGNYHGFELEGLYAFTDNLTVLQNFRYSNTLNHSIGPKMSYRQYELEFIYAF